MRKFFLMFVVVYCYLSGYFLLTNSVGLVADIKPRMSHSFFYYSYVRQCQFFSTNDIATTKHREFYYYLFFPIDRLTNSYYEGVQNDEEQ